jgi:hypothetical protein
VKVIVCKTLKTKLDIPYIHLLGILGNSKNETQTIDDGIFRTGLLLNKNIN